MVRKNATNLIGLTASPTLGSALLVNEVGWAPNYLVSHTWNELGKKIKVLKAKRYTVIAHPSSVN